MNFPYQIDVRLYFFLRLSSMKNSFDLLVYEQVRLKKLVM